MIHATNSRIRRVAIAGNGFEAWLTAATLANRLDRGLTEITVCPVDGSDAWDDLYAVLPLTPADAVRQLGISDAQLVSRCGGSFSLGAEFSGERFAGGQTLKPYGATGVDYGGTHFHHYWLRSAPGKPVSDYFEYSPGARAMRARAFAPPDPRNAIGPLQHEYARHVEPALLAWYLREIAMASGVKETASPIREVGHYEGGKQIRHLLTESGESITAELFVDCTGPARTLLLSCGDVEWLESTPGRRYSLSFAHSKTSDTPPPWHSVSAKPDGWVIDVPCRSGVIRCDFSAADGGPNDFVPGHASSPWMRNCVALGHAAHATIPIEPMQVLHLMESIGRLVALLPGPDCSPGETVEFNQLSLRDLNEIHDLLALHELMRDSRTFDLPDLTDIDTSEALRRRLALFAKRGWVSKTDSHVIPAHAWSAAFLFYGLIPEQYDLLAERIPADTLRENLAEMSRHIGNIVAEFPPLEAILAAAGATR